MLRITAAVLVLGGLLITAAALAQDPPVSLPAPVPAPAIDAAPAAPDKSPDGAGLRLNETALAGIVSTLVGAAVYAGKLLTTGYVKALTEQIQGLSQQLKLSNEQNMQIAAQNDRQIEEILALKRQLATVTCPHLGADGVCRRAAAAATAETPPGESH